MTATQQTQLAQLKAACRRALELADAATAGPWGTNMGGAAEAIVCDDTGFMVCTVNQFAASFGDKKDEANAAHIAQARTFAPAAARALLTTVEALEGSGVAPDPALLALLDQWPDAPL